MDEALLIAHIATAVLFIGPVTVATAMFPGMAAQSGQEGAARLLHRMTRVYAPLCLLTPGIGFGLAFADDLLDTAWVGISLLLSGVGGVLLWMIVADQERALAARRPPRRLAILSAAFALSWIAILILMVARPG